MSFNRREKMTEEPNLKKMQEQFDKASLVEQACITFTACVRRICESNISPDIKGDAMTIALRYLQSATRLEFCIKILEADEKKDCQSLGTLIAVTGLDCFETMNEKQKQLKNIMELF
jgi:hypothetical protein